MVLRQLPPAAAQLDEVYYRNLPDSKRQAIDQAAAQPRAEIARRSLRQKDAQGRTVVEALRDRYNVRFVRFGHEAGDFDGDAWLNGGPLTADADVPRVRKSTDLTAALEDAIAKVPSEALGGVLLLSDGRHNGEIPAEDAARHLGSQGSPICAVTIGSTIGPRDASVLRVDAPQSIYLGDRIAVRTEVKLDGLQGQKVRARLLADDPSDFAAAWEAISEHAALGQLKQVTVPALVIGGSLDLATSVEAITVLADAFAHGQRVILEGAPHMMQIENQDVFYTAVRHFLDQMGQ
jgi:hypothetical protein